MVSPTVWPAVGATQWFPDYRMVSILDFPLARKLGSISLARHAEGRVLPQKVKGILESPLLTEVISQNHLEDYALLLNRPTAAAPRESLGNSYEVASKYENKVWLRKSFAGKVPFPEFRILTFGELRERSFSDLAAELGGELVVQHASLSGGRGTYHVKNAPGLEKCVRSLLEVVAHDDEIVVSKRLVNASERTLQGCVTSKDVLVGPPQAQLVGHPRLTSPRPGDIQFCGGRIAQDLLGEEHYNQAAEYMRLIGKKLQSEGYRGIFGMDFLVSQGELYAIEVNPRMTALTTLLAFIQKDVPFLLLHILELAGSPYTLAGGREDTTAEGSFILVYAQRDMLVSFSTGRYDRHGNKVSEGFESGTILPENDDFFVGMRVADGQRAAQGKSLAFIYSRRQLFGDDGTLDPDVLPLISKIRS